MRKQKFDFEVRKLLEYGMSPKEIAIIFGLQESDVLARAVEYGYTERDEEFASAIRGLAWRVIEETHTMLNELPAAQKQKFLVSILARLTPLVNQQAPAMLDDLRRDMDSLMGAIREQVAGPDDEDPDDPQQGSGAGQAGAELGTVASLARDRTSVP